MSELANKMHLNPKSLESADRYVDAVIEMIDHTSYMHCSATPADGLNEILVHRQSLDNQSRLVLFSKSCDLFLHRASSRIV